MRFLALCFREDVSSCLQSHDSLRSSCRDSERCSSGNGPARSHIACSALHEQILATGLVMLPLHAFLSLTPVISLPAIDILFVDFSQVRKLRRSCSRIATQSTPAVLSEACRYGTHRTCNGAEADLRLWGIHDTRSAQHPASTKVQCSQVNPKGFSSGVCVTRVLTPCGALNTVYVSNRRRVIALASPTQPRGQDGPDEPEASPSPTENQDKTLFLPKQVSYRFQL